LEQLGAACSSSFVETAGLLKQLEAATLMKQFETAGSLKQQL